jgi:hypothetical protein
METRLEVLSQSVAAPPQFERSALRVPLPWVARVNAQHFRDVLAERLAADATVRFARMTWGSILAAPPDLAKLAAAQDVVLPDGGLLEAFTPSDAITGAQAEELLLRAAQRRALTILCCGEGDDAVVNAMRVRRTLPRALVLGSLRMDGKTATTSGRAALVGRIASLEPGLLLCTARTPFGLRALRDVAESGRYRHAVFRVH